MGTVWIREFTGGLDTRKLVETSKGGTLVRAVDCHINRGGEVEQRAAFVKVYDLPAGTVGLAFRPSGLVVFGSADAPAMPDGVAYQRLQHPDGATKLTRVESSDLFSGKTYASATFADATLYHFYDGARVTDYGGNSAITPGRFVRTFGQKMNFISGPNLVYSALKNATSYDTANAGAGFNDLSEEDYGSEDLTAIGKYQNYLAIFSDRTVQIRYMDPDPTQSKAIQALHNTGTVSPRSVTQFGDNDLFYLDASGIRSLRARDASNSAVTTDIGSAVDTLVTDSVSDVTDDQLYRAIGLIEPRDGRYWMILADQIFVFSYFPSAKVSAWTTYRPGFLIEDAVVFKRRVYVRSGDAIYVYGGLGRAFEYDDTAAVMWAPYLDAEKPTIEKTWNGIDVACRGEWQIDFAMDPSNEAASDKVAIVDGTTYAENRLPAGHKSTHVSVRLTSKGSRDEGGPNTVGSVVIHYEGDEKDEAKA